MDHGVVVHGLNPAELLVWWKRVRCLFFKNPFSLLAFSFEFRPFGQQ